MILIRSNDSNVPSGDTTSRKNSPQDPRKGGGGGQSRQSRPAPYAVTVDVGRCRSASVLSGYPRHVTQSTPYLSASTRSRSEEEYPSNVLSRDIFSPNLKRKHRNVRCLPRKSTRTYVRRSKMSPLSMHISEAENEHAFRGMPAETHAYPADSTRMKMETLEVLEVSSSALGDVRNESSARRLRV